MDQGTASRRSPLGEALEEERYLQYARSGDITAFNQLVLAYQEAVFNLALRVLGDYEDARDVTQEAFISAFRRIRSFRGGSFRAWLYRICVNACYDCFRRRQRRRTISLEQTMKSSVAEVEVLDPADSPDVVALQRETAQVLQEGLLSLPDDQRVAIVLADVHGLSYEEIAAATASPLGTVKSRISRGRMHLRDYLRRHGELE